MKQFLIFTYRLIVPARLKRILPHSLKARMTGILFKLTHHPDFGFLHARHLNATGRTAEAVRLYTSLYQERLEQNFSQKIEFELVNELVQKGATTVEDPLFQCSLEIAGVGKYHETPVGRFHANFGYQGLKITGEVNVPRNQPCAGLPQHVDIVINDHVLRREKLNFAEGKARIRFTVKRQALAMFDSVCNLALRTSQGSYLINDENTTHLRLNIPHGDGSIFGQLDATGPLDKKGWPRLTPEKMFEKQNRYLELYTRARIAFMEEFNKPLFVLYGTLLGQHRTGDFIPGDDDFDVGYVSDYTTPEEVKAEAIEIMERLVARGMIILLNRQGKPHRLRDIESGTEIHLDNRPVFTRNDGHVWLHKLARIEMDLDDFRNVETARLRDTEVFKPRGTETFLAGYYGPGWRVPDPSFSNASKVITPEIEQTLAAICLSVREQQQMKSRLSARNLPGEFIPIALQKLYPLDEYATKVGI